MEPGAFKLDYIATQAGQSSAGMPENGCRTKRRRKQNPFQRSSWKWPVLRGSPTQHLTTHYTLHYTQHYTLHYTQHYRTAGTGSILELWGFKEMKWKNTSQFFCPGRKCCPWERFGSVACSLACSVACIVAWVLRVVCSVVCGGCHVAYFASCSAVCRWRVRHTLGELWEQPPKDDPLEVAGGGKKFARPKIQEFLFFLRYWNFMCLGEELQRSSGQKLKDVLAICIGLSDHSCLN